MEIALRKKKLATAEEILSAKNQKLKRTMTSIRFWERRVKMHQKALQAELEEALAVREQNEAGTARKFR